MTERDGLSSKPAHRGAIRIAEGALPNRIGGYELTDEEREEVIRQNECRGTLHLIHERNSFKHRDNAGRHESIS